MRNMARGLLITLALMTWGLDASVAEDVPPTSLQAAAAILKGQGKPSLKKPSAALMAAMEHLGTMPKIHTRAFAERVDHPEERTQMIADLEGLEKLLEGVACLTPALESASNKEFVSSLNLLLNLRNHVLKPGSYGNLVAAMGVTQYAGRLSLDRLFQSPAAANLLRPVVSGYADHAIPSWAELAVALAEETQGKMRLGLKADTPLRRGLTEILRFPSDVPLTKDTEIAERGGPYGVAIWSLTESQHRTMLIATPYNLDQAHPVGLVVHLGATEYLIGGWVWWAAFLQKHKTVPETLSQVEEAFREGEVPSLSNRLLDRPFQARDVFGYLLMRNRFGKQAMMFLVRGPQALHER